MRSEDITEEDWLYVRMAAPRTMDTIERKHFSGELLSWRLEPNNTFETTESVEFDGVRYLPVVRIKRSWDRSIVEYMLYIKGNDVTLQFLSQIGAR